MRCPCYGCDSTRRSETCHGACTEYQGWREALDDHNAKAYEAKRRTRESRALHTATVRHPIPQI